MSDDVAMPGFTTGPLIDDPERRAAGIDIVPSHAFDQWSAAPDFAQAARWDARQQAEYGSAIGDQDTGIVTIAPEPRIAAADATAKYGIPGELAFDRDVPESVAKQLNEGKRDELARQDAERRQPADIWASAARFGAGVVQLLTDPLDLAAGFIPVVGEARYAAWLARAGGLFGRTAIRAGVGAAQGAVSQIPLSGLRYMLSRDEQADYSATQALTDIAYGGLGGGALHALGGAVHDVFTDRFTASPDGKAAGASLDLREAALRTSIAQLADGRPVEVRPAFEAERARQGLEPDDAARATLTDALRQVVAGGDRAEPQLSRAADEAVRTPEPKPEEQMALLGVDREAAAPGAAGQNALRQGALPAMAEFRPDELGVDAKTFQYKGGADQAGVTDRLQDIGRWDPVKAGLVVAYQDDQGAKWIADGHQRLALAQRIAAANPGEPTPTLRGWLLRAQDGVTPEMARTVAAAKNIAEGTGSAIDAARLLRSAPEAAADLPPRSELVRSARALANLKGDAFGMVANGLVSERYAAIVGRLEPEDPARQLALVDLLHKTGPENLTEAEAIVRQGQAAGFAKQTQGSLFGENEIATSLFKDRARVLDRAMKEMRGDRRLFALVSGQRGKLEDAGNVLATDTNLGRAETDARALQILQSLANRTGPISDALNAAARRAHDERSVAGAARDFIAAIRTAVERGDLDRLSDGRDSGAALAQLAGTQRETGGGASLAAPEDTEQMMAERGARIDAELKQAIAAQDQLMPDPLAALERGYTPEEKVALTRATAAKNAAHWHQVDQAGLEAANEGLKQADLLGRALEQAALCMGMRA